VKARDVMTSPVIVIRPDTPAREAAALLCAHGFTAAPVVDGQRWVVGMATEADLVRGRIPPDGWVVEDYADRVVEAVMTTEPAVMSPDDDLADVVAVMLDTEVLRAVARRELTSNDVLRRRSG
jgi:CBS-domain-containing membrane protein